MAYMKGRQHTDVAALRRLVAERGMSLKALAGSAGLSYSFIKEVARGRRQLSDRTAIKVARILGVDPAQFFQSVEPDPGGSTGEPSKRPA